MARLIGTSVFDPLGDEVGKVHDVVVLLQMRGEPRAVGFVIEVSSRRRVFLPLSRITAIEPGAVITTGLMNIRRFTQRHVETLVVGELLDRVVTMRDGSGTVTVRDVAIERDRGMDWKVTRLFVQRASSGPLGLRRGETFTVRPDEVSGLAASADQQGATALLATLEDLKPAALAAVGFVCRPPLESPTGKFLGMIHFQRALRERPQRMVGSIVDTDVDSVRPEDSIGTVTRLLATYNLTALPVLDDAGRLLGAVSVDDVLDHLMPDDWRVADEAVTDETIERGANA